MWAYGVPTPTGAADPPLCHSSSQKTCGASFFHQKGMPPWPKGGAWKKGEKKNACIPPTCWWKMVIYHGRISKIALKKQKHMNQVILCDLFGMVKWPFSMVKWPPTRWSKGHFESPGKGFLNKGYLPIWIPNHQQPKPLLERMDGFFWKSSNRQGCFWWKKQHRKKSSEGCVLSNPWGGKINCHYPIRLLKIYNSMKQSVPGDSKWPFGHLVGGNLTI